MFCLVLRKDDEILLFLYQVKEEQFKMIYKRNTDYFNKNLIPMVKVSKTSFLYVICESKKMICLNIKEKFAELKEFQVDVQYPITKVLNMERTIAIG